MAKKVTMAARVREYTKANPQAPAKEIAQALSTKTQYVHSVWYLDRKIKKDATKSKMGRKAVQSPKNNALKRRLGMLPPVPGLIENSSESWHRVRKLETQIMQFRTVISYLEHQLGLKDSQHGTSV